MTLAGLVALCAYFVLVVIGRFGRAYPGHDVYAQGFPGLLYVRSAVEKGHGLLWNDLQNCGQPFFAMISSALLDPTNVLILALDPDLARELGVFVDLLIAALGTFLVGRALGLRRAAAFSGAIAFILGGAVASVGRTHHVILGSYAWLPWVAFLCERIVRRPRASTGVGLGVVLTLQLFAGYPQLLLFSYQWLALRFGFEAVTSPRASLVRAGGVLALGMALAPLLGAIQLAPALEVAQLSLRSSALSRSEIPLGATGAQAFEAFRAQLGIRGFGAGNLLPVVGVPLAGLALVATGLRRIGVFLLLVVGLSFALSFVDRVADLYQAFPLGRLVRIPSRHLWLASFALSIAIACGFETAARGRRPARAGLALGGAAALLLAGLHALTPTGFFAWEWLLLACTAGIVAAAILFGARPLFVEATLLALLTCNLVVIAGNPALLIERPGFDLPYSESRGVVFGQRRAFALVEEHRTPQDRIYQVGRRFDYTLTEKSASVFGTPSIVDYEHQTSRRYAEYFVRMLDGKRLTSLDQFIQRMRPLPANHPLFHLLAARYLMLDVRRTRDVSSFDPPLRLIGRRGDVAVFENPAALPRAFYVPELEVVRDPARSIERLASRSHDPRRVALVEAPPADGFLGHGPGGTGSASIVTARSEELEIDVRASQEGFLFVSDQYYPGWEATVDGAPTPIERANHAFRVVRVPAGASRVAFHYRPQSLLVGAAISGATLLALALWALRSLRGK